MPLAFTRGQEEPLYTKPLYGIHAKYTLSEGVELPYFLTAMEIERAIDELRTHDQVAPSLDRRWSLSELFQREVDEDRVKRDLVRGYLNDKGKLKFFNAITIVLMPQNDRGDLLSAFDNVSYEPSIPWNGTDAYDKQWADESICKRVAFGGVQYVTAESQARLRWNPELVRAVAVDGQHRLLALRKFREEARARALTPTEKQTHIPVIFLLLDTKAGFKHRGHGEISIRTVSRELFTDLNKNAKPVDLARQLILDDLSIEARCLRTLVTNETMTDSSTELPLSLVRWQDAINRFDQNYYLNSMVHMGLLVDTVVDLDPPKDPMDGTQVERFIRSLDTALGVNGSGARELRAGDRSLREVFRQEYCDEEGEMQTPFMRLPANFLDAAVKGFVENHKGWLLKMLRDFKPYVALVEYARKHNLIEGEFGRFWSQTKLHRELIYQQKIAGDSEWYNKTIQRHIDAIEQLKGRDADAMWAFKAIFQKAMVRLGRRVAFEYGGRDPAMGAIDDLLAVLTRIHDRNVLRVGAPLLGSEFGVWTFIATNPGGGKIKVAKATEDRILSILTLWYYANRKIGIDRAADPVKKFTAKDLLNEFSRKGSRTTWPECDDHYSRLHSAFNCQGLHQDASASERTKKRNVQRHFEQVLAAGVLEELAGSDMDEAEGDA